MKKLMLILAAAGAIASVGSAAQADHVVVPGVGTVHTDGSSYVHAEGNDDNGLGPLSGFIYASTSRVCADDNGNYAASASPTCVPA
ncbi:MAG TPA: hypothetical protein VNB24_10115 [Acidimicrobiales bacterium]|nr:hypothetical protein [Acidimicrobiales bacterium]